MDARLAQFAKGLYFELQSIEGVKPLEIWSGFREMQDSYEKAGLVKNLYKIVIPLANERGYGRPFSEHSRLAFETVNAVIRWYAADLDAALFRMETPRGARIVELDGAAAPEGTGLYPERPRE